MTRGSSIFSPARYVVAMSSAGFIVWTRRNLPCREHSLLAWPVTNGLKVRRLTNQANVPPPAGKVRFGDSPPKRRISPKSQFCAQSSPRTPQNPDVSPDSLLEVGFPCLTTTYAKRPGFAEIRPVDVRAASARLRNVRHLRRCSSAWAPTLLARCRR